MNRSIFEHSAFSNMTDRVMRPGGLKTTMRLVEYCAFPTAAKVIDIGCGTGITVEYLCNIYGLKAIGVDLSAVLLQQGKKRSPWLELIQAAGEDLPFAANSVNGVVSECSLSVMRNVDRVLAEVNRILVPQGKLAMSDIYSRSQDDAKSSLGFASGIMTYEAWKKKLKDNGFMIIFWDDQSVLLKEFVASFIIKHGTVEELWRCLFSETGRSNNILAAMKTIKLGYFILVAAKIA